MSRRSPFRILLVCLSIVLVVSAIAVGWHYANRILGPDRPKPPRGQAVLARTDSTVTLAATFKARRPGHWALVWPGGFGHVDSILSIDGDRVVRQFRRASGPPPGDDARLAGYAVDADPRSWLGLDYEEVTVPARAGPMPAWLLPGADSTWAVFVHGRAATRAEVLRMLASYRALGLPCLVITYRNDSDRGARVGDGSYRLGATEWRDVEDAVQWALERGARDVVVVGCSMGGAVVAQYLRKSARVAATRAAVLDSPALDWGAIVSAHGRAEHVPDFVTAWGKCWAALRGDLSWDDLSQLRHAHEFRTPMLILHGDADTEVPLGLSHAFATARPDLVTLVERPGVGHVESWNFDSTRCAATIEAWLTARGIGGGPRGISAAAAPRNPVPATATSASGPAGARRR